MSPALPRLLLSGACAAGLLAVSCLGTTSGLPEPVETRTEPLRGSRIEPPSHPLLGEVAVLEDARSTGGGRLFDLARHESSVVRERAATALGRLPFPEEGAAVTDALVTLLGDGVAEVRIAAAFGLGLREDPRAGAALLATQDDDDPRLRAAAVEALSKLERPDLHGALLRALRDPDLGVQVAGVLATARWSRDAPSAAAVDRALLELLEPREPTRRDVDPRPVNPELGWRALFALARRKASTARGVFLDGLRSSRPLERLFAARGCAWLEADRETVDALLDALAAETDPNVAGDWRVATEAIGALERLGDARAHAALVAATHDAASFHVRAAAARALASFPARADEGTTALARALRDLSPTVRNEALVALAKLAPAAEAWNAIEDFGRSDDPVARLGAVLAAGELDDERSLAYLLDRLHDEDELVSTAAVPLVAERGDRVRDQLHRLLENADNGLRLAAALALEEAPRPGDVEPLARAFETTQGDVSTEVAFHALVALSKLPTPRTRAVVEAATRDPRPFVRRVARERLAEAWGEDVAPVPAERPAPSENVRLPDYAFNPIVEVRTTKGTLVFELFPAEAPMHVHNFLLLASRRHYEGLRFHRVVSDFVIQGGDYRGDGNGAAPAFGVELAHEIGPRRYVRGSLGMPRYEYADSGGSQFFVTHRPTPHLDGRYTVFGELRAGNDVLDAVEVGDRILAVELVRSNP